MFSKKGKIGKGQTNTRSNKLEHELELKHELEHKLAHELKPVRTTPSYVHAIADVFGELRDFNDCRALLCGEGDFGKDKK